MQHFIQTFPFFNHWTQKVSQLLFIVLLLMTDQSLATRFNQITTSDGLPHTNIKSIVRDRQGTVWIGTVRGLAKYNGYAVTEVRKNNGDVIEGVHSLQYDEQNNNLWIGSLKEGVFYLNDGQLNKFEATGNNSAFEQFLFSDRYLWIVFSDQLLKVDANLNAETISKPFESTVNSMTERRPGILLLSTKDEVFEFDTSSEEFKAIPIDTTHGNRRLHPLHKDFNGNVWLGRSDGMYRYDQECGCFAQKIAGLNGIEIYAIKSDPEGLWVGTTRDGLFRYVNQTDRLTHFLHNSQNPDGLRDNTVFSILVTDDDLWLGTFNAGVNYLNLSSLSFGSWSSQDAVLHCSESDLIFALYEDPIDGVWLGTGAGMVHFNASTGQCTQYSHHPDDPHSLSGKYVYSFYRDSKNQLWLTTSAGLSRMNADSSQVERFGGELSGMGVYFMQETNSGVFIAGTNHGLFQFETGSIGISRLDDHLAKQLLFYHHANDQDGNHWFGTTSGLYILEEGELVSFPVTVGGQTIKDISGFDIDENGGFYLAADYRYYLHINKDRKIADLSHLIPDEAKNNAIYETLVDGDDLWISSDSGMIRMNRASQTSRLFKKTDGLHSDDFLKLSSHKGASGKLYFGGRSGFNAFYPEDITINETPPPVVLTAVSQLNKPIARGQSTRGGFVLEQPLEQLDHLQLSHKDLDIGFEFAALDFADPMRNQYAYRLLGFNDDWQRVGADNRRANFTNLKPGEYTFQVKAANKDGVWNTVPKELAIKVYPAPWFSPWAYAAYVLIILASIWGFIRYKTLASRRRARELEVQVAERTQEVVTQKQMVESLLDHKNEVFANVTHEFKTPLSLIVGPADQLAESADLAGHQEQVSMIKRNAQRLLLMVGQILKLSQAEQDKAVIREVQEVQPVCLMLYESFAPLARDKGLELTLKSDHDVNVYATHECLEMVIGNLLSNAVKYTPSGGRIELATRVEGDQVQITVSDSGPGISDQDKDRVFNRFVRLDGHQGVQGTGIGLAVVKEVTVANKGHVQVLDNPGGGAQFVISLPLTDLEPDGGFSEVMTEQLVSNTRIEMSEVQAVNQVQVDEDDRRPTVLIIEDNPDMQQHTLSVLQSRFQCWLASRGDEGIGLALKEIPDIIICDVMMPGMDGYQVTRMLRNDPRTSHIPIILLTALNTRESRIKGWREKIDRYVTKPFDAHELHAQLDNILSVRQLLQSQTVEAIESRDDLSTLDLSKQDIKFLDQLKAVIEEVFANEYIQKADLADRMAVSERQLQRKVKALIGVGPLDMLRDHRLEHGRKKLKEGLQVSQVSDLCGFSSLSYFGTCFKKKYGMTPKQFQQLK
jgi:signal transduction histidine kinase/ligand-binding sensor domain-containing protein/DNA-binding response OmpR family regulator